MSFKTRIHPSPYTATIPSLVVKQWPKFRRLGPHRRLGMAMLSMLPAMRCLSLIFTLHGGAGDDGRPSPGRSRGFAGSLNGRPKMEVPQNEFPPTTSSPTARTWGQQLDSSQRLTSKRQRSKKRVCATAFCRRVRVSPRRPELPRSSRERRIANHGTPAHGQLDTSIKIPSAKNLDSLLG